MRTHHGLLLHDGQEERQQGTACLISGPSENLLHKPQFGEAPASGTPGGGGFFVFFGGGKKRKMGSSNVKDDGTVVFGDDLRYYKVVEVYSPANRRTYL